MYRTNMAVETRRQIRTLVFDDDDKQYDAV